MELIEYRVTAATAFRHSMDHCTERYKACMKLARDPEMSNKMAIDMIDSANHWVERYDRAAQAHAYHWEMSVYG